MAPHLQSLHMFSTEHELSRERELVKYSFKNLFMIVCYKQRQEIIEPSKSRAE